MLSEEDGVLLKQKLTWASCTAGYKWSKIILACLYSWQDMKQNLFPKPFIYVNIGLSLITETLNLKAAKTFSSRGSPWQEKT